MKIPFLFILSIISIINVFSQDSKYNSLFEVLGKFPDPPILKIDTLESIKLDNGIRYKIEYLVEYPDSIFNEPVDIVKAYLFVPYCNKTEKLPAIVAIHQDANNTHIGKSEPAGFETFDSYPDQKYGLELFNRGYIVICPDRFGHAERRRLPSYDSINVNPERDGELFNHRVGQLLLKGRNRIGKEVYDLMRAVDVLYSMNCVDTSKIGAIGHSAGGNALVYFMFADKRIKVGVSSCGFYELINDFRENNYSKSWATNAIPGLANIGKSADYLSYLAPRPILLTRGIYEFSGHPNGVERSKAHVEETEKMITHAKMLYKKFNAEDNISAIYFDGGHFFPANVKIRSYLFLDKYLSPDKYLVNNKLYDNYKALIDYFSIDTSFCNIFFPKAKQDHLEYLLCSYKLDEYNHTVAELQCQKKKIKKPIEITYSNFDFKIYAPGAKNVQIRGSFNNWQNEELVKQDDGNWEISKKLRKGIYTFGYFVDRTFTLDQNCGTYYGALGEKLSVIEIK